MEPFQDAFAAKRVLVTGHTGFKGAWLTTWLLKLGAVVCGYSIDVPTDPSLFESAGLASLIQDVRGDIRDTAYLARMVADFRPDYVIHMAAQAIVSASYIDPLDTVAVNVMGTASILSALRHVEHPCVCVSVTSDKCYENVEQLWGYRETDRLGGKDVYSASKGAAEIVTSSFQRSFFSRPDSPVRIVSVRAGNVLGGGDWAKDRIIADCMRAWLKGETVVLRRPEATRPWQHVLEPLSGYLALAAATADNASLNGEGFNFGPRPDRDHTVAEMFVDMARHWGLSRPDEGFVVEAAPGFAEAGLLKLNCEKALSRLGWEATLTYAECVEAVVGWYDQATRRGADPLELTRGQIEWYTALARDRGRPWASGPSM